MPFGTNTCITNVGKAIVADRLRTSPGTYANAPKYCAMGHGATGAGRTAAVGDTSLSSEVENRATGTESTQTTTLTKDTYQVTGTIAVTSGWSIDEFGLFDTVTSGTGNMFLSATFPAQPVLAGQTVMFVVKVQSI